VLLRLFLVLLVLQALSVQLVLPVQLVLLGLLRLFLVLLVLQVVSVQLVLPVQPVQQAPLVLLDQVAVLH
jgi:hypothetical protein